MADYSSRPQRWLADLTREEGRLPQLESISKIATRLTAIVGIIIAVVQLISFVRSATSTLDAVKLQALDKVLGILETDATIQKKQGLYLTTATAAIQVKLVDEALKKNITGQQFYWSDAAKSFTEVAEHYERLGAILRLGYLDFETIFQIVVFPDHFWNSTRELRKKLRENWLGPNRPLRDLLTNFRWLCNRYQKERARQNYESAKGMDCRS